MSPPPQPQRTRLGFGVVRVSLPESVNTTIQEYPGLTYSNPDKPYICGIVPAEGTGDLIGHHVTLLRRSKVFDHREAISNFNSSVSSVVLPPGEWVVNDIVFIETSGTREVPDAGCVALKLAREESLTSARAELCEKCPEEDINVSESDYLFHVTLAWFHDEYFARMFIRYIYEHGVHSRFNVTHDTRVIPAII